MQKILLSVIFFLCSCGLLFSQPDGHDGYYLKVSNGTGSDYYQPRDNASISATVPSGFRFAVWHKRQPAGFVESFFSANTTVTTASETLNMTAISAKLESWFGIGPQNSSNDTLVLLERPPEGSPHRFPVKVRLSIHHGSDLKVEKARKYLKVRLGWFPTAESIADGWHSDELISCWTEQSGGSQLNRDEYLPYTLFEDKGDGLFEATIWYSGEWSEKTTEEGIKIPSPEAMIGFKLYAVQAPSANEFFQLVSNTRSMELLKVDLEDYESLEDFNQIANHISNDVQTAPEPTPEEERTVELIFSPSDFFQNYSDRITFEISSLTPDTSPNKGSIDDTAFKDSGGVEPVRYVSKFEAANTYMWDDPAIQTQEIGIRVLFDGNEVFDVVKPPYNLIHVFSRFTYLWFKFPDVTEEERAEKAIEHVMWKYNLSFPYTPEFDGSMGAAGETRAYGVDPPLLAPYGIAWDGVYVGNAAMASEQFLANTLVHEHSHYEDGFGYVFLSSLGHDRYFEWVDGGRTETLSNQDVINIFAWIEGEKESILDQQAHPTYGYMHPGETLDIERYWDDHIGYQNDMHAHGYSQ